VLPPVKESYFQTEVLPCFDPWWPDFENSSDPIWKLERFANRALFRYNNPRFYIRIWWRQRK
jgi:hypothetical protein